LTSAFIVGKAGTNVEVAAIWCDAERCSGGDEGLGMVATVDNARLATDIVLTLSTTERFVSVAQRLDDS
jgi:hypothetical protein